MTRNSNKNLSNFTSCGFFCQTLCDKEEGKNTTPVDLFDLQNTQVHSANHWFFSLLFSFAVSGHHNKRCHIQPQACAWTVITAGVKDALQSEVFVWKSTVSFSVAIHQSDGRCARVIRLTASYYSPFPLSLSLQPCFLKYACPTFFFPPPYRIQMHVPRSCLCSPLPSCFICGWPNFQVGSILQFGD